MTERISDYAGQRIHMRFGHRSAIYMPSVPKLVSGKRDSYIFERHQVAAGDLPEHSFDGHMMLLPLGHKSVCFESRLNGKFIKGRIEPRRFRFLAAGDTLSTVWNGSMDSILLSVHPNVLMHTLDMDAGLPHVEFASRIQPHEDSVLMHLMLTMHFYLASGGLEGRLFEQSLLSTIASHLLRSYADGRRQVRQRARLPRWKRAQVEDYIHANLAGSLSLSSLAAIAELSTYQLCRNYRATTGQSLWQFVLECRANAALDLITRRPALPLTMVASTCGFESYSQFIAAFRKHYGLLPNEYRRSLGR